MRSFTESGGASPKRDRAGRNLFISALDLCPTMLYIPRRLAVEFYETTSVCSATTTNLQIANMAAQTAEALANLKGKRVIIKWKV